MTHEHHKAMNAELGAEFDLFALEHADWMAANVPHGAIVVLQTDDTEFNAWARGIAERNRHLDRPAPPIVLVHIRELRPAQSRIVMNRLDSLAASNSFSPSASSTSLCVNDPLHERKSIATLSRAARFSNDASRASRQGYAKQ
jgi:hypothetical protein